LRKPSACASGRVGRCDVTIEELEALTLEGAVSPGLADPSRFLNSLAQRIVATPIKVG
jgi:hypothetical protein